MSAIYNTTAAPRIWIMISGMCNIFEFPEAKAEKMRCFLFVVVRVERSSWRVECVAIDAVGPVSSG